MSDQEKQQGPEDIQVSAPEATPEADGETTVGNEEEEEEKLSTDQLESLYNTALECYQPLWLMSRSRIPWDDALVKSAKGFVREIEAALRNVAEDYDAFRRIWRQDTSNLSEPLRLTTEEAILRNLADLQDDLLQTLARRDPLIVKVTDFLDA